MVLPKWLLQRNPVTQDQTKGVTQLVDVSKGDRGKELPEPEGTFAAISDNRPDRRARTGYALPGRGWLELG